MENFWVAVIERLSAASVLLAALVPLIILYTREIRNLIAAQRELIADLSRVVQELSNELGGLREEVTALRRTIEAANGRG